jgi:hypothetical protein
MKILHTYNKYSLSLKTGEKYFCVPMDNVRYIDHGLKYLGNLADITDGYYDSEATISKYPSLQYVPLSNGMAFYRCMATGTKFRSVWGTDTLMDAPGSSVTIIYRGFSAVQKTVYLLIFADNYFKIYHNDMNNPIIEMKLDNTINGVHPPSAFECLNIFPVTLNEGYNTFKFVGVQGYTSIYGNYNGLGVLVLDNAISDILNVNFPQSRWNVLYTSEIAITVGIYWKYEVTVIPIYNYLGVTPIINCPPNIIEGWTMDWGDSTTSSGVIISDLSHKYATAGIKNIVMTVTLSSGRILQSTEQIEVLNV